MKPLTTKVAKSTFQKNSDRHRFVFFGLFYIILNNKILKIHIFLVCFCMLKNSCKSKNLQVHCMSISKIVKSNMIFNFNNKLYYSVLYRIIDYTICIAYEYTYYLVYTIIIDYIIIYHYTIIRSII